MNLHLLPLACVHLLGAWVLWPLGWYVSQGYGLYAVISNLVFISTICACCAQRANCPGARFTVGERGKPT